MECMFDLGADAIANQYIITAGPVAEGFYAFIYFGTLT